MIRLRRALTAVAAAVALTASVLVLTSQPAAALETSNVTDISFRVSWTNHPDADRETRVRINRGTSDNLRSGTDPCSSVDIANQREAGTWVNCHYRGVNGTATSFYDLQGSTQYYIGVWQYLNNRWTKHDSGTVTTRTEVPETTRASLRISLGRPDNSYRNHDSLVATVSGANSQLGYRVILKEGTSLPESYRDYDHVRLMVGNGSARFIGLLKPNTTYRACVYQVGLRERSQFCPNLRTTSPPSHVGGQNSEIEVGATDTAACNGSVVVAWNNLFTGGIEDVTRVQVQYKLSTDSSWTTATADADAERAAGAREAFTVSGLTRNQDYDFRVTMADGARAGDYNDASWRTGTLCALPSQKVTVTGSPGPNCGEVVVRWSGGKGTADRYWVTWSVFNSGQISNPVELASTATSHTITGLGSGTVVVVDVFRSNTDDFMQGASSDKVTSQTGTC